VTLAAFWTLVAIGGVNFVAVRFSNRELDAVFGAGVRFSVAATLLIGWVLVRRVPWPSGRGLVAAAIYGVLSFGVSYALAYWALQELSAGIGAVVFGATPLLTLLLAVAHRLESLTRRGILGSLVALVGIVVLASPSSGSSVPALPLLAMLGAAVGAAEAGVILKLVPAQRPVATNAVAMAIGAVVLMITSAVIGEQWVIPDEPETWVALVYLIVPGSVGLFALFLFTLARWTASAVSYMTALFPVIAVLAGWLLADEAITVSGALGGLIVIVGVYLGALRPPPVRESVG
jgi:drug/metabolite transporter (DMT)-like permease